MLFLTLPFVCYFQSPKSYPLSLSSLFQFCMTFYAVCFLFYHMQYSANHSASCIYLFCILFSLASVTLHTYTSTVYTVLSHVLFFVYHTIYSPALSHTQYFFTFPVFGHILYDLSNNLSTMTCCILHQYILSTLSPSSITFYFLNHKLFPSSHFLLLLCSISSITLPNDYLFLSLTFVISATTHPKCLI
jgi:uncharacterized membrane protein